MGVCDRILAMCEGRIVKEFLREDFNEGAILVAALPVRAPETPIREIAS
jgi:L-arabinose transport system ATP-binding protein